MKRQKTLTIMAVIVFVLCAIGLFAIAGCKTDETDEHEHTFMRVWSSNAEGHWHKATCEHTEEKGDYAAHVDVEQPYDVCDVCGYKMEHKHRYEENWSYDAENHWHNSTCNDVADDGREAHAWGRAVFVEPTCEEDGYNLYTCSVCGATKTEPTPNSPALSHAIGAEIVPDVPATCSKEGVKAHYECSVCHEIFKKTDDVDDNGNPIYEKMTHEEYAIEIDEDAHEWDNGRETTPATCTTLGVMTYTCLNNPDHTKTGEIPMTPHEWNADGECIHCGADRPYRILPDEEQTNSNFTLLEMGRYPQSQEKDAGKLAELKEKYPETPTDSNANGWTEDLDYQDDHEKDAEGNVISDKAMLWYRDVDLDNDGTYDYRGVIFDKVRTTWKGGKTQSSYGYEINNVYWFKWEPILWRMLQKQVHVLQPEEPEEDKDTTKAIIITDKILDGRRYDHGTDTNYETSDLRKFLTNDFYNSAFDDNLHNYIMEMPLDDDIRNEMIANYKDEEYTKPKTLSDKIFALSNDELFLKYKIAFADISIGAGGSDITIGDRVPTPTTLLTSYPSGGNYDITKVTKEDYLRQVFTVTDYAKALGVNDSDSESIRLKCVPPVATGPFWTRTVMRGMGFNNHVMTAQCTGVFTVGASVYSVNGVLPAMWIRL